MTTEDPTDLDLRAETARLIEGVEVRAADDGGHFLRGIVAPYGEPFDAGDFVETFAPGVFKKSVSQRGDRIGLTEMHRRDSFPIGRATGWEDTNDGLVATFTLAPTERAREALELVTTGFLNGLSVGFKPLRNRVENRGDRRHVERVEAALDHVGLVHAPAYDGARVLAARDDHGDDFDPDSPLHAPRLARWRALTGHRV